MATFRRLLGFLRPYRRSVIGSLVFAWMAMGMTVLIPWLVGRTVNAIGAVADLADSYDLVVIGAGPAGLAAAALASECGLQTLLVDENPSVGGQIYRAVTQSPISDPTILGADYWRGRLFAEYSVVAVPVGLGIGALVDGAINRTIFDRTRVRRLTVTPFVGGRFGVQAALKF